MRPAKKKSTILAITHKAYERSLVFYPKELRGDFGDEMVEVFDEQVWEAYCRGGLPGVLRTWCRAMREIITVAVPGRLVERAVPIVAATATMVFMAWFANYISHVMETACSGCIIH